MQRFELSLNDTIRLLTREPLLIEWLPILKPGLPNTMRLVRKKSYQDHTFALCIPLEIDDDDLVSLKLDHLSWLRFDLINSWINYSFSTMMVSWRYIWDHTQSYSSRHTQYSLNSLMTNLHITPWITPWSSHNILYFYLHTILKPTNGSSIVYGQVLQI
jgi:hypothetical protein